MLPCVRCVHAAMREVCTREREVCTCCSGFDARRHHCFVLMTHPHGQVFLNQQAARERGRRAREVRQGLTGVENVSCCFNTASHCRHFRLPAHMVGKWDFLGGC